MSNSIKVYLRIRPTKKPSGLFQIVDEESTRVDFNIPQDLAQSHINNTKSEYKFKFDGVIDQDAKQDDVFRVVAEDAICNALEGYNSTIFAYGQTGSGKTFTITGGAERYVDRGIIPRTLSRIFSVVEERNDSTFTVYVSYLEIYNENGYDLLDQNHDSKGFDGLRRASLMEDEDGNIHMKNLSMHHASSEEDALNLLFLGDTNRAISETPMNLASSRSHCIFTISIEARKNGSEVIRTSKLHIVDLAGSERVHKTHASGKVLREAKYINTSLHYLEMVIVALREKKTKGRQHIPYRNSMMTSVLRDSLGGNCKTAMIATVSAERSNTEETISTCKFAQRVTLIENNAFINETVDPQVMIQKLKGEVRSLKEEMSYLRNETGEDEELDEQEIERLRNLCDAWVHIPDESLLEPGNLSYQRIHMCFKLLKDLVQDALKNGRGGSRSAATGGSAESKEDTQEELEDLRMKLHQRDNEITILVNMVKQAGATGDLGGPAISESQDYQSAPPLGSTGPHDRGVPAAETTIHGVAKNATVTVPKFDNDADAFAWFAKTHSSAPALEENKSILRQKYDEAKATAERVNRARGEIEKLKAAIDQVRTQRAVHELMDNGADEDTADYEQQLDQEKRCMKDIELQKMQYKREYQTLKELKTEIEQIKKIMKKGRVRLQMDFEAWHSVMKREQGSNATPEGPNSSSTDSHPRDDDRTEHPPSTTREFPGKRSHRTEEKTSNNDDSNQLDMQNLPLTGNEEADADIIAFYKAKEQLMQRRRRSVHK